MFSDTYAALANSFNEWLEVSPTGGSYVADLTLEYANRAEDSLWSDPPNGWSLLTRSSLLTITNLIATLPAGKPLRIYSDDDSDGKPDRFYFKDGRIIEGFKFIPAFARATGHTTTIQFYQPPIEPVYCDYQIILVPLTGTGTEYLFFPKSLMLGKMQYLHCINKGMLAEWQALATEFNRELERFKSQHQNPMEMPDLPIKDYCGREVYIPPYNLLAGLEGRGRLAGSTNDRDSYRR